MASSIALPAGLPVDAAVGEQTPPSCSNHTIADVGLIGGGQVPRPGDMSLAHHGILFLYELAACRRHVLEVLRQPLEKNLIQIQSPERAQLP
jgi:magnesium chelatase family protein